MKAVVIREFGGPEVMRLEEVPTPVPGPGEVVIRVHAVSVNRTLDLVVRSGKYAMPVTLPHVLGVDPSGGVSAVGLAAAGTDARVKAAEGLGADAGVNYRAQDLTEEVKRITGGAGVNVVFENIGDPDLFPKAFAALARGGRLITAGGHGGGTVPLDVKRLYLFQNTIIGTFGKVLASDVELGLKTSAEGRWRVLIDRVLPLADAAKAHRLVDERSGIGKVILQPTAS